MPQQTNKPEQLAAAHDAADSVTPEGGKGR